MSDPRVTPDPSRNTRREAARVTASVADLCAAPGARRERQLIYGDTVMVLDEAEGWSYLQADRNGYCGFVASRALGTPIAATHRVSTLATHAYEGPDLKSCDRMSLSFGSRLCVTGTSGRFADTDAGHVPLGHLEPLGTVHEDPARIAALFLETPYLWGGNSRLGIDCSGLVQAAFSACGIPTPGDSDLQRTLGEDAAPPYRRNDLLFWKGHVAIVTDPDTMIHANAHAMAVCYEPIEQAIRRIEEAGDGHATAHRRLPVLSGFKYSPPEA